MTLMAEIREKKRRFRLDAMPALMLVLLGAGVVLSPGQEPAPSPADDPFQHYASAGKHLAAGEEAAASGEFKVFLSLVLHQLASATATTGRFDKAEPLFAECVSLSPGDAALRMDYSRTLFNQTKFVQAKEQAAKAVELEPQNPQAHLLLGQVLYQLRDMAGARAQLEKTWTSEPDFATGYLLGKADLLLHDEQAARAVFASIVREWGDTDVNHIFLGRAFSQTGYANEASDEFHRALEINPKAHMAHYQLGISYLREDETAGYDRAIPEFQAELATNPDDGPSHYMLGYIADKQGRWDQAEVELSRAMTLQPRNLAVMMALADTYIGTKRPKRAEEILRRVISMGESQVTSDITRAHYLLGRLLISQPGHEEEGKRELALVAEMQKHSGTVLTADARETAASSPLREEAMGPGESSPAVTQPTGPESHAADDLRARIADAYNNLGAIAGDAHDFPSAASYFRRAQQWNSALPGIDHNLGMALFYSGQFREAATPLKSYVDANGADVAARGALGFTLFRVADYAGVVACLRPMQEQMKQTPKLAFVYAAALARTGAYDQAIPQLQAIETASPNSAEVHYELMQAYQRMGKSDEATRESQIYERLKAPSEPAPK